MNFLLEADKDKDQIKVVVSNTELMRISLSSFIEEADKFLNDKQDDIFAKSIDNYSRYGHAIEFQRDLSNENLLSIFIYNELVNGAVYSTINELKSFVQEYR